MERVAFLLEDTGERIGCLLNPESLVVRRVAGIRARQSLGGALTGAMLADDPLLFTGGGTTELLLDLLFDVTITGSTIETEDVRELTAPLWNLAENAAGDDGYGRIPVARFVWGKSWNIAGIVASVAERLEYFTIGGAPRRSWLRMRFLRVLEPTARTRAAQPQITGGSFEAPMPGAANLADSIQAHEVVGSDSGDEGGAAGERLDQIANQYYGNPGLWKALAAFNNLSDPARIPSGTVLQVPPLSALKGE